VPLRFAFRRFSSITRSLGLLCLFGLGACSLSQEDSSQYVRIQISPEALRASRAGPLFAKEGGFSQDGGPTEAPDESGGGQSIDPPLGGSSFFLINVEGPGIPFMPMPGFPCIRLGIGASVFVGDSERNVPIELWVPAGPDRKVSAYSVSFSTVAQSPISRQSATEFFGTSLASGSSGGGAASAGSTMLPSGMSWISKYGEAFLPNLFGDQTVEISEASWTTSDLCGFSDEVGTLVSPPPLTDLSASPSLRLTNYSPYFGTEPMKTWSLPSGLTEWAFRVSGEIENVNSENLTLTNLSSSLTNTGTMSLEITLRRMTLPSSLSPGAVHRFYDLFSISGLSGSAVNSLNHKISASKNSTSLEIFRDFQLDQSAEALLVSFANVVPVSGHTNLYKVRVIATEPIRMRPVKPGAIFSMSTSSTSRIDDFVLVPPPPSTAVVPTCPMTGLGPSGGLVLNSGQACDLYFAAISSAIADPIRLEVDVAKGIDASQSRFAQFQIMDGASSGILADRTVHEKVINLATRPFPVPEDGNLVIPYPTPVVPLASPTLISSELEAGPFKTLGAGASIISTGFLIPDLIRSKECATRASLLVRGKLSDSATSYTYRREVVNLPPCLDQVQSVSAGRNHTCALLQTGSVRSVSCWGKNASGQLGNSVETGLSPSPKAIAVRELATNAIKIASGDDHTCTLHGSGTGSTIQCWGNNDSYQLGRLLEGGEKATVNPRPRGVVLDPSQDGSSAFTDATEIAAGGAHTCALKGDGKVWCWGSNDFGQTGAIPAGSPYPVTIAPTMVSNLSGATQIALGKNHSCAIVSGGHVKCWGKNDRGQLGNGATGDSSSPVAVLTSGSSTPLSGVVNLALGDEHSCALKSDNTLWCWGAISGAQLVSLVPLPDGVSTVKKIDAGGSRTCIVAGDDKVYCRDFGVNSSSFALVSLSVSGISIPLSGANPSVGVNHACVVWNQDQVVCWGNGGNGQLGIGEIPSGTSPLPPGRVVK
jgi:alpha-tubulin suppressor-like RCC1 family protein